MSRDGVRGDPHKDPPPAQLRTFLQNPAKSWFLPLFGTVIVACLPLAIDEKPALRRQLRKLRQALPITQRAVAELAIARRASLYLKRGHKIAIYLAVGSELDLAPLIRRARQRGVKLYLPLIPKRGRRMRFALLDAPKGHWRKNRYGIAEYQSPHSIPAQKLDLAFLPLLGFDPQGGRLGQGGGYYDASFDFRRWRKHWRKPRLIGLAFECQKLAQIPVLPHDIQLDVTLTEIKSYSQM